MKKLNNIILADLSNLLLQWEDMDFTLGVVNNHLYINDIKLCNYYSIECVIEGEDLVTLEMIDGSSICICMQWVDGEKPYIYQIYREKLDKNGEEEWDCMIYDCNNS